MSNDVKNDVSDRPIGHSAGHARHDRLLVSRFAAGDTGAAETAQARDLVKQCTDCARLAADVELLRTAITALPTPPRPRNFRLTAEQAEQLRGSALDRFLRRLAMPQLALLRPVAGVALALGLVITVVGAGLPGSFLPQAASAPTQVGAAGEPASQQASSQPEQSQLVAPVGLPSDSRQNPSSTGQTDTVVGSLGPQSTTEPISAASASDATHTATDNGTSAPAPAPTSTKTAFVSVTSAQPTNFAPAPPADSGTADTADNTRLLLIYGGVTLAMIAFAVLLISLYARRRTDDPLLR